MNGITRDTLEYLIDNISWIFTIADDEDDIAESIEKLLVDEGIISIIED